MGNTARKQDWENCSAGHWHKHANCGRPQAMATKKQNLEGGSKCVFGMLDVR